MTAEERKEQLEKTLQDHFALKIINDIPNIDHPLLLILDYSPQNKATSLVSFAFSLQKYYDGNDEEFSQRFWITERSTRDPDSQNNNTPNYHPDYKEFDHKNYHFYPFSADLDGKYNFLNISNMNSLLKGIYSVIIFN